MSSCLESASNRCCTHSPLTNRHMTLAERIKAAIGILEGKTTADKAEIASITKMKDDAVAALAPLQAQVADLTAQLAAAQADTQAETDAVVQLEALAAQP